MHGQIFTQYSGISSHSMGACINILLSTSMCNQIWACPLAAMVAEMASIVLAGGQ
jgi:hypothetical protein